VLTVHVGINPRRQGEGIGERDREEKRHDIKCVIEITVVVQSCIQTAFQNYLKDRDHSISSLIPVLIH
jgi:hypothetical protein